MTETPKVAYAAFAGMIDQQSLPRIFQSLAGASQGGTKEVHLLFQSSGGIIGDGISLYHFFKALPSDMELHLYNAGSIQSIAVLAYLGGLYRHTSAHGTFMIHKSHFPAQPGARAAQLDALAKTLVIEDARIEAVLKTEATIPDEKWVLHALQDVTFSAKEAVDFGIADDIREFDVPDGNKFYNI
jgi:ATP-dependent protease ClpP protease subunit